MHVVTTVCVIRSVDRHEHMSRSYTSMSRSYRLFRTCAGHEAICRDHPTPRKKGPRLLCVVVLYDDGHHSCVIICITCMFCYSLFKMIV